VVPYKFPMESWNQKALRIGAVGASVEGIDGLEGHGGEISITSQTDAEGHGTTDRVLLPLHTMNTLLPRWG